MVQQEITEIILEALRQQRHKQSEVKMLSDGGEKTKNSEKCEQKLEQHKHYKAVNYATFKNSEKYRKYWKIIKSILTMIVRAKC